MRELVGGSADNRPIPAPDGSVVQAEVAKVLGGGLKVDGQKDGVVAEVFQKAVKERICRVVLAKGDPIGALGNIDNLLEEGNTAFLPEIVAKQKG